jgi:hypothetical protein
MEADLAVAGGALVEQIAGFLAGGGESAAESDKVAKLAQKLGQLRSFLAVFPQECVANLHLLGQPNTFSAEAVTLLGVAMEGCLLLQTAPLPALDGAAACLPAPGNTGSWECHAPGAAASATACQAAALSSGSGAACRYAPRTGLRALCLSDPADSPQPAPTAGSQPASAE